MPDIGSARTDFPRGDARILYKSIQKILAYLNETKLFVCHDYPPETRQVSWVTTVGEQKNNNIHISNKFNEEFSLILLERTEQFQIFYQCHVSLQ